MCGLLMAWMVPWVYLLGVCHVCMLSCFLLAVRKPGVLAEELNHFPRPCTHGTGIHDDDWDAPQ